MADAVRLTVSNFFSTVPDRRDDFRGFAVNASRPRRVHCQPSRPGAADRPESPRTVGETWSARTRPTAHGGPQSESRQALRGRGKVFLRQARRGGSAAGKMFRARSGRFAETFAQRLARTVAHPRARQSILPELL